MSKHMSKLMSKLMSKGTHTLRRAFVVAAIGFAALPATAYAQNNSGLYIAGRLGYTTPSSSLGDSYKIDKTASYGAEAGYDLPLLAGVTVGPFVSYDVPANSGCDSVSCVRTKGALNYGGRAAVGVGPVALYAKVGREAFDINETTNNVTVKRSLDGVSGAIGMQVPLSGMFVNLEANFSDMGDIGNGNDIQRSQMTLSIGKRF